MIPNSLVGNSQPIYGGALSIWGWLLVEDDYDALAAVLE
jgi:dTDP-D-glucose 4,6-dehydratase